MCELGGIWRNRVQHDRVATVIEVERPEYGEPTIVFTFIDGPLNVLGSEGRMPLEQFLKYWSHLNEP